MLAGVRNCPNSDFLVAVVFRDTLNLVFSSADNNGLLPSYAEIGHSSYLRLFADKSLLSYLRSLISTPSERSLRYRWVRSIPASLAILLTLPMCFSSW